MLIIPDIHEPWIGDFVPLNVVIAHNAWTQFISIQLMRSLSWRKSVLIRFDCANCGRPILLLETFINTHKAVGQSIQVEIRAKRMLINRLLYAWT